MKITSVYATTFGDGTLDSTVIAHDDRGVEYTHYRRDLLPSIALDLAARVMVAGTINPDLWERRVPYGSDAWDDEGCEAELAHEERYGGLGDGTELAHVW